MEEVMRALNKSGRIEGLLSGRCRARNEAIATVDRVCGRSKHDRKILMFAEGEEFTGPPGAAPTTEITRGTSNPATRRRLCDNPAVDNPLSGGLSP